MKKTTFLLLPLALSLFASSFAQANNTWIGNFRTEVKIRDSDVIDNYNDGRRLEINLCGYGTRYFRFDYYKSGVTDVPNTSIWQNINAKAQLIKDSDQSVITWNYISAGSGFPNVTYSLYLNSLNPNVYGNMDPELQNRGTMKTHINIVMDGVVQKTVPVDYTCIE